MAIVVGTTITDERMLGRVMKRNIWKPLTPSMLASMISSGMALIAAERTVIANGLDPDHDDVIPKVFPGHCRGSRWVHPDLGEQS